MEMGFLPTALNNIFLGNVFTNYDAIQQSLM